MSIETDLATIAKNSTRIADALELIAKNGGTTVTSVAASPATEPAAAPAKPATPKAATKPTEPKTVEPSAAELEAAAAEVARVAAEEAAAEEARVAAEAAAAAPEVDPLAPAVEAAEPAGDRKYGPDDVDTIRAALVAYRQIEGAPAVMKLLEEFGAKDMPSLDPDKYDAIMARIA